MSRQRGLGRTPRESNEIVRARSPHAGLSRGGTSKNLTDTERRNARACGAASPEGLLDCLLAALEHRGLPPTEVRLLLWLAAREATPAELSEALGQTPDAIERATRRLDMRGLIRRRFERGRQSRFIFSITSAGLLCLDPLVQCVAETGPVGEANAETARTPAQDRAEVGQLDGYVRRP